MIKQSIKSFLHKTNMFEEFAKMNRYLIRKQWLEDKMLYCKEMGISKERYADSEIVVSLTSYGRRIDYVAYTIESLMQQTIKANRIVLWLSSLDYQKGLPSTLLAQIARGLEVRETKDIRSYKKIIPSLHYYPNSAIITTDDDVLYDFDLLGRFITAYRNDSSKIYAARTHVITKNNNGEIKPYNEWNLCAFDYEHPNLNYFTGVGGVLYPPHSLSPNVMDEDVFFDICKTADDVWLNAMSRLNGTIVSRIKTKNMNGEDYVEIPDVQDMGLTTVNNLGDCLNDICIKNVFSKYNINVF